MNPEQAFAEAQFDLSDLFRIVRETSDEKDVAARVVALSPATSLHVRLHQNHCGAGDVRSGLTRAIDCIQKQTRCQYLDGHAGQLERMPAGFGDDWRGWVARLPTMPAAELAVALGAIDDEEGCYLWGHGAAAWAAIEEAARRLKGLGALVADDESSWRGGYELTDDAGDKLFRLAGIPSRCAGKL